MKRQLPRMIEEAPETQEAAVVPSKRSRFSKQLSIEENNEPNSQQVTIIKFIYNGLSCRCLCIKAQQFS